MKPKYLTIPVLITTILVLIWVGLPRPDEVKARPSQSILQDKGTLQWIRINDVGTGYGPANDHIDVEVVFKLQSSDQQYGFKLRSGDRNLEPHQGMLDLLREAMTNQWMVLVEYDNSKGGKNYEIFRLTAGRSL